MCRAKLVVVSAALLVIAVAAVATSAEEKPAARVEWSFNGEKNVGSLRATGGGYKPCDPAVKQYSGYFDIDASTDKHYFYWAFESRGNPYSDPVILWMTGGPGCSSGLALMAENGPCKINSLNQLEPNPYSWNYAATVIYIDQPAGVGFSYAEKAGYDSNETEVANDMYNFMQAFYTAYPQFLNVALFVYGESYGGHFAPATAHRIWQGMQNKEGLYIPLTGLSVGNGLTAPQIQYDYYAELAYNWCMQVKGEPCVSLATYNQMVAAQPKCISLIKDCNQNNNNSACFAADDFCGNTQMGPFEDTGLNVYDIRIPCEVPGLCYNFTLVTNFFNSPAVQTALGVRPTVWTTCSYDVNGMFGSDWMHNFNQLVPDLLNSGIRVLIYAGDCDFICNWLGNRAWTLALPWSGQAAFNAVGEKPWYLDDAPAGMYRSIGVGNVKMLFTFLQIHGAGHMVPMDKPKQALDMVRHFLSDTPFI